MKQCMSSLWNSRKLTIQLGGRSYIILVVSVCGWSVLFVERLLIYGEATCKNREEGITKSSRKPVYGMCYFWTCDAVEIVRVVVW